MRTGAIVGLALFWVITVGAQGGGGQATGAAKAQNTSSEEAAIKQVADAYVKATLAGDAKAIAALYTEDAVEMPPNVPSVKGRAAIEQYYMKLFSGDTKVGQFALTHLESRAVGDTGYDFGPTSRA
jgi:ketosteroid isomerase-like protein